MSEMNMMPRGLQHEYCAADDPTTTTINTVTASSTPPTEIGCIGGDGGTGRWPRQETLTLLEIRSRLDPKFKEANQKGPLWDEVSRIMCEEHGYQRSGKKCREKFENLYKYYKKTKEGKAGRQDGKHYRFFRQLEALYGESSNTNPASISECHLLPFHPAQVTNQDAFQPQNKLCDSLSLSNSSGFDTSSSEDNEYSVEKGKKRRGSSSWKAKIKDFIDLQMKKLMEKQESWLDKMVKTIETREQERMMREEEWRNQEAARVEREHKFWANERAWIQARDAALMEALQNLSNGREVQLQELQRLGEKQNRIGSEIFNCNVKSWPDSEISRLIQLRTSMQSSECLEDVLWDEIATKMACLGYDRSALMCKDKWDSINNYLRKTKESNYKKRKENYYSLYNPEGGGTYCEMNEQGGQETTRVQNNHESSPCNSSAEQGNDSCFRFLIGDHGKNMWENYGHDVKPEKGENN